MSEQEQPSGTSSSTWIIIGVIALVAGGGCLVACLGLLGIGFALPMRQAQQQAIQAEAARQELKKAGERAHADSVKEQQEAVDSAAQGLPHGDALEESPKKDQEETPPSGTDETSPKETGEGAESPDGEAGDMPK